MKVRPSVAEGIKATFDFIGGNWKGVVEKSVLSIQFTQPGDYSIRKQYSSSPHDSSTQFPHIERHGNQLTYTWRHWQAQEEFDVSYDYTIPGGLAGVPLKELRLPAERHVEFIAIAPRSGSRAPIYSPKPMVAFWRNGEVWASCKWLAQRTTLEGKEYPLR